MEKINKHNNQKELVAKIKGITTKFDFAAADRIRAVGLANKDGSAVEDGHNRDTGEFASARKCVADRVKRNRHHSYDCTQILCIIKKNYYRKNLTQTK